MLNTHHHVHASHIHYLWCRRPAAPIIRLGAIAKKLPLEARLAVADAVAYDPPSSGRSSGQNPDGHTPSAVQPAVNGISTSGQQLPQQPAGQPGSAGQGPGTFARISTQARS